jgi:hypothetical protein
MGEWDSWSVSAPTSTVHVTHSDQAGYPLYRPPLLCRVRQFLRTLMEAHVVKRLWGLECSQVWRYFRSDAKDPRFVKLLVSWSKSSDLHLDADAFL